MKSYHKSKYGSKKKKFDGLVFDSNLEYNCYLILKSEGLLTDVHPKFILQDGFEHKGKRIRPIYYIGDFLIEYAGKSYVIDSKGFFTPIYRLKKKLFMFKYPNIELVEIKSVKKLNEFLNKLK